MSQSAAVSGHLAISNLKPGTPCNCVYHLVNLEQRTKKNGDPYFMMVLGDASGTVNAIIWDNHAALVSGMIVRDDFVLVEGDAGEYNGNLQLTLRRISRVEDSEVDLNNFLATSPRDRAEMEEELDEWIAKVQDPDCKRLLERVFSHSRLRDMYCTAPAAARVHQAYIHGLLEHTLNVMKLADSIANVYEPINRDLLITGTLIHDIGKIRELDWRRTITYTTEGRLLGHIPMGASMIDAVINELRKKEDFDRNLQAQILHLILSHHGKLEYGSPITPKTREALVLHYADNTEAYMAAFTTEVNKAAEKGESWTGYNRMFESYLFAGGSSAVDPSPGGESLPKYRTEEKPSPIEDVSSIK